MTKAAERAQVDRFGGFVVITTRGHHIAEILPYVPVGSLPRPLGTMHRVLHSQLTSWPPQDSSAPKRPTSVLLLLPLSVKFSKQFV
jgi:hypothetical protein